MSSIWLKKGMENVNTKKYCFHLEKKTIWFMSTLSGLTLLAVFPKYFHTVCQVLQGIVCRGREGAETSGRFTQGFSQSRFTTEAYSSEVHCRRFDKMKWHPAWWQQTLLLPGHCCSVYWMRWLTETNIHWKMHKSVLHPGTCFLHL